MPIGKFVSMGVYVDDKKLPEYQIKDKIYTEVDLHGPTSYTIEEDEQVIYCMEKKEKKRRGVGVGRAWFFLCMQLKYICTCVYRHVSTVVHSVDNDCTCSCRTLYITILLLLSDQLHSCEDYITVGVDMKRRRRERNID